MSTKTNKKNWWWPETSDLESAKQAAKYGFWAAAWVASVTAIVATIAMATNQDILGSIDRSAYVDAVLFAVVAWRIRRYSRAFAVIGLALYVVEKALLIQTLAGAGWIQAGILLFMFVAGVRGVFAYHRFMR